MSIEPGHGDHVAFHWVEIDPEDNKDLTFNQLKVRDRERQRLRQTLKKKDRDSDRQADSGWEMTLKTSRISLLIS